MLDGAMFKFLGPSSYESSLIAYLLGNFDGILLDKLLYFLFTLVDIKLLELDLFYLRWN